MKRLLLMADRERFWAHFLRMAVLMGASEWDRWRVYAILPWSDPHAQGLAAVATALEAAEAEIHIVSPRNRDARLAELLARICPHVCLLCPEHLQPMRQAKTLLRGLGNRAPVLAMQHGLWQRFTPHTRAYCDAMLGWGHLSSRILRSGAAPPGVPLHVTGTPKFDGYECHDAEDHGFVLVHAPHEHGRPSLLGPDWIERARAAVAEAGYADAPLVVKAHCNDLDARRPPNDGLRWIAPGAHPRDMVRTCRALYLDYPSTAWIEARCYGKPVVLAGAAREWLSETPLDLALLRGDAMGRFALALDDARPLDDEKDTP